MIDLPDTWRQLIEALLQAATAWQTPAELACALGWSLDETSDVLAALDEAGWLESWEREPSPLVTLSPLAAERLGVRLVEIGLRGDLRWLAQGDPEPPPPRSCPASTHARGMSLESVPDPHPAPDVVAERAEEQERRSSRRRARGAQAVGAEEDEDLRWPTLLLGLSLTPWPGPRRQDDERWTCPVCGTKRLEPNMYCLLCDRWGRDESVRRARAPRAPSSESAAARTEERKLRKEAFEMERARTVRKARRRARFAARAQAEDEHAGRNGAPLPKTGLQDVPSTGSE